MNGAGIYFADNPMSALIKSRILNPSVMIVAKVNVGRLTVENGPHNDWNLSIVNQKGYDSVQTNCKSGLEICVYESWRVDIVEYYHLQCRRFINGILFRYTNEINSNKVFNIFFEARKVGNFSFTVTCTMIGQNQKQTIKAGANINRLHIFCDFALF